MSCLLIQLCLLEHVAEGGASSTLQPPGRDGENGKQGVWTCESLAQWGFMQVVGFLLLFLFAFLLFKQCCHNVSRHICGSERWRYFLLVYNVKASFRGYQMCCSLFPCLSWNNPLVIEMMWNANVFDHSTFQIQNRFINKQETFITINQNPKKVWNSTPVLTLPCLFAEVTSPACRYLLLSAGMCSRAKQSWLCQEVHNTSVFS